MTKEDEAKKNCSDVHESVNRKRKNSTNGNGNGNSTECQNSKKINHNNNKEGQEEEDDEDNMLSLSLSLCPTKPIRDIPEQESSPLPSESLDSLLVTMPPLQVSLSESIPQLQRPLQLSPTHAIYVPSLNDTLLPVCRHQEPATQKPLRLRRNPTQAPGEGKGDTVPALFPWATTKRATVQSFNSLVAKNITTISGDVQCKKCEQQYKMEYDLREKFLEVWRFIADNKSSMHDRAPNVWMNPVLPTCKFCGQENSAKPVIPLKKKQMNWLFLLLGQLLGCCTLDQLKYFCKHTKNHRTGAKDRVLYLTYLGLCKQLDPSGPFDR